MQSELENLKKWLKKQADEAEDNNYHILAEWIREKLMKRINKLSKG